jgi:hypothetical protein
MLRKQKELPKMNAILRTSETVGSDINNKHKVGILVKLDTPGVC